MERTDKVEVNSLYIISMSVFSPSLSLCLSRCLSLSLSLSVSLHPSLPLLFLSLFLSLCVSQPLSLSFTSFPKGALMEECLLGTCTYRDPTSLERYVHSLKSSVEHFLSFGLNWICPFPFLFYLILSYLILSSFFYIFLHLIIFYLFYLFEFPTF